jgi:hypothetical protein
MKFFCDRDLCHWQYKHHFVEKLQNSSKVIELSNGICDRFCCESWNFIGYSIDKF